MTAIYRPNSSWGPPQSVTSAPNPQLVAQRLIILAPEEEKWTRKQDLSITEAACSGLTIAGISSRLRRAEAVVRQRWISLKRAACEADQPFGLSEQEALLTALRSLVVKS